MQSLKAEDPVWSQICPSVLHNAMDVSIFLFFRLPVEAASHKVGNSLLEHLLLLSFGFHTLLVFPGLDWLLTLYVFFPLPLSGSNPWSFTPETPSPYFDGFIYPASSF